MVSAQMASHAFGVQKFTGIFRYGELQPVTTCAQSVIFLSLIAIFMTYLCLAAIIVPTFFKGLEVVLKLKDFQPETSTPHFVFSDLLKLQVFVLESYYAPTNRVLGA
jgi:hypothetical protein